MPATGGDDQVVEQLDIQQLAGFDDLPRHLHVFSIYMENTDRLV
jgi:hypothetical protein